jgi:hypothetical protein
MQLILYLSSSIAALPPVLRFETQSAASPLLRCLPPCKSLIGLSHGKPWTCPMLGVRAHAAEVTKTADSLQFHRLWCRYRGWTYLDRSSYVISLDFMWRMHRPDHLTLFQTLSLSGLSSRFRRPPMLRRSPLRLFTFVTRLIWLCWRL